MCSSLKRTVQFRPGGCSKESGFLLKIKADASFPFLIRCKHIYLSLLCSHGGCPRWSRISLCLCEITRCQCCPNLCMLSFAVQELNDTRLLEVHFWPSTKFMFQVLSGVLAVLWIVIGQPNVSCQLRHNRSNRTSLLYSKNAKEQWKVHGREMMTSKPLVFEENMLFWESKKK